MRPRLPGQDQRFADATRERTGPGPPQSAVDFLRGFFEAPILIALLTVVGGIVGFSLDSPNAPWILAACVLVALASVVVAHRLRRRRRERSD
jgi:hypothetical protein